MNVAFFLDACTLISRASKPLLNCFKALRFVSSSRDTRWMAFLRAQDDEREWEWKISLLLASALPARRLSCGELHQSGLFNRLKTNAGNYLGQLFDLDLVKVSAVVLELSLLWTCRRVYPCVTVDTCALRICMPEVRPEEWAAVIQAKDTGNKSKMHPMSSKA